MVTDQGRLNALTDFISILRNYVIGLYTGGGPVVEGSTFAQLTEANWPGYGRVTINNWSPAVLQAPLAVSVPLTFPLFNNTDTIDHAYAGWFILDSAHQLVAGPDRDFVGVVLPAGGSIRLYLSASVKGL